MEDLILIYTGVIGAILCIGLGFIVGRMLDLPFRIKTLRRFLKKDYGILNIVNRDAKTIKSIMVNFANDVIQNGTEIWIIEKGHIYRKDKREKGDYVTETNVRWEEGVPCVYVDHDSLKCIDFYPDTSNIRPAEAGSTLMSWITNQVNKAMSSQMNIRTLLLIAIGVAAGALILSYLSWSATNNLAGQLGPLIAQNQSLIQNATNVIIQPTPGR